MKKQELYKDTGERRETLKAKVLKIILARKDVTRYMLAEILAGSVGERLCNFLSFAIQDTDLMRKEIFEEMELV